MSNARRRAVTVPGRHVGRSKRLQGDRWGVPLSATHESSVGTRECKEKHKFKGNYIHRCFSLACQEDSVIIMSVEYFGRIWACQIPLLQIREIMDRNHRCPPPPFWLRDVSLCTLQQDWCSLPWERAARVGSGRRGCYGRFWHRVSTEHLLEAHFFSRYLRWGSVRRIWGTGMSLDKTHDYTAVSKRLHWLKPLNRCGLHLQWPP